MNMSTKPINGKAIYTAVAYKSVVSMFDTHIHMYVNAFVYVYVQLHVYVYQPYTWEISMISVTYRFHMSASMVS